MKKSTKSTLLWTLCLLALSAVVFASPVIMWQDKEGAIAVRDLPPGQFVKFLKNSPYREDEYALLGLFMREEFTSETLHQAAKIFLSEHKNGNERAVGKLERVVRHRNVNAKTLLLLAESSDVALQRLVASKPEIPVKILRKMSLRKDDEINLSLARNPNTPADILHELAKSTDNETRWRVAGNPNTCKEDLLMLAKDSRSDVRLYVLKNPSCPKEIKKALRKGLHNNPDRSDYVKRYFEENKKNRRP